MSIAAVAHHRHVLPDTAYNLWLRDELADYLELPHDGTRAEIIDGEIVVSPGPDVAHNEIVQDIQERVFTLKATDPKFVWRCLHSVDLNLSDIHDGYIPDLSLLHRDIAVQARKAQLKKLPPEHLQLTLEVTSPSNAGDDREPGPRRSTITKWNGHARVGIPYYLLVDRDPKSAKSTLFFEPDRSTGDYAQHMSWEFGETIRLPEPFGFDIPTDKWEPWL